MSYFIAKGGVVYVFHGMTPWKQYAQYATAFSATMSGFKNLDDPSKINVKPERLVVKNAAKAGSAAATLKQLGTPDTDLEQRTILNGMHLTDNVTAGTLIKTIAK
jgi:predicted Zn-dependent protease